MIGQAGTKGYVYLIHLDQPLAPNHTSQHYIGWARTKLRLHERLRRHLNGNGARFLEVAAQRGIGWRVVRVWRGSRQRERRLKSQHNTPLLCPVCNSRAFNREVDCVVESIDDLLTY